MNPPTPPQPAANTKTSAAAIWALVLGISSLCIGITALPGLILGIIGVNKTSQPGGPSGKGLAITGIVTSCVGFITGLALLMSITMPVGNRMVETARMTKAASMASAIVITLKVYESDHGELPPNLQTLIDSGELEEEVFANPMSLHEPGIHYELLLQGSLDGLSANTPLIRSKFGTPVRNGKQKIIVGYVSGSVQIESVEADSGQP